MRSLVLLSWIDLNGVREAALGFRSVRAMWGSECFVILGTTYKVNTIVLYTFYVVAGQLRVTIYRKKSVYFLHRHFVGNVTYFFFYRAAHKQICIVIFKLPNFKYCDWLHNNYYTELCLLCSWIHTWPSHIQADHFCSCADVATSQIYHMMMNGDRFLFPIRDRYRHARLVTKTMNSVRLCSSEAKLKVMQLSYGDKSSIPRIHRACFTLKKFTKDVVFCYVQNLTFKLTQSVEICAFQSNL